MAESIIDGRGSNNEARVDKTGRLHTHSVAESLIEYSASQGDSYNINTGTLVLTSSNLSSLLYIKNNGLAEIHIASIGYLMGTSTGGSGDIEISVLRNPSAGTVLTSAAAVMINQNKNTGSSKELIIDVYKGGEAKTLTNGTPFYASLIAGAARSYVITTGTIVVPRGGSVGVQLKPQTGNTNMGVQVFMSVTEYNIDA